MTVTVGELGRNTTRHLANELFTAIKRGEWKNYYRDHGTGGLTTIAGGQIPKGIRGEIEPKLELVGRGIATLTLPDHALGVHDAFAIYLPEDAFNWALTDFEWEGLWDGFMTALSSNINRPFRRQAPFDRHAQAFYRRQEGIPESAATASVRLLSYAELHRLSTESVDAFLDALPVPDENFHVCR